MKIYFFRTKNKPIMSWCEGVKGVLLDVTGVLYNSGPTGGAAIEGSIDAIQR